MIPKHQNLYTGGLAEIVTKPSKLTYSFLKYWFSGEGSYGESLKLLGFAYKPIDKPVLVLLKNDLYYDLDAEQEIFYDQTLLKYKQQIYINQTPELVLSLSSFLNLKKVINTFKLIFVQASWISDTNGVLHKCRRWYNSIPELETSLTFNEIDEILPNKIWPRVIAIDFICEYFNKFLNQEIKNRKDRQTIEKYISQEVAKSDWLYKSISNQYEVATDSMTPSEYIELYGIRSDKDYEIACPRWDEGPEELLNRINSNVVARVHPEPIEHRNFGSINKYINLVIELQILRSEVRRKVLMAIKVLRGSIIDVAGKKDIADITRDQIVDNKLVNPVDEGVVESLAEILPTPEKMNARHGRGLGVSLGTIKGTAQVIVDPAQNVNKGCIGIFPSAGVDFSMLYRKCSGLIFLRGGTTSHGAIVAREMGIPAIVDENAGSITNNAIVEIDGLVGKWEIIK